MLPTAPVKSRHFHFIYFEKTIHRNKDCFDGIYYIYLSLTSLMYMNIFFYTDNFIKHEHSDFKRVLGLQLVCSWIAVGLQLDWNWISAGF